MGVSSIAVRLGCWSEGLPPLLTYFLEVRVLEFFYVIFTFLGYRLTLACEAYELSGWSLQFSGWSLQFSGWSLSAFRAASLQ